MRRFLTSFLFLLVATAQICLCANSTVPNCIERERQALLKFKASLRDPMNRLSSWNGIHCCQWKGIACDNVTGHVLKLDLRDPCLPPSHSLPLEEELGTSLECVNYVTSLQAPNVNPSLLQLEYLIYLDLSGNYFNSSSIPMFFGSMGHLTHLSLSWDNFGGKIPNNLSNLKNLQLLDISHNFGLQTNGIDWISELKSLEHLDMSGVKLGEKNNLFQVLNMLPSLTNVYLADCGIDNYHIPYNAFQNMTSLIHIDLSGNGLQSPLPNAFKNLTSIESLFLSFNGIVSVPSWFCDFKKLAVLDLASNQFLGAIPDTFRNMSSLVGLDLSWNKLNSIPSWFSNLKLVYLDLSSNEFGGSIPGALNNMSSLAHLDLSSNEFGGTIPGALNNMSSLAHLDLSENRLNSIPSWFGNLKLVYLDLSWNELDGPIPETLKNMTSIEFLDLSENGFTSVPSWFVELNTLVHLDLSRNELTSIKCSFSSILSNMCHLKSLRFSNNKLQGELIGSHNELFGCISYDLEELDLSFNAFSDRLPAWLGQLENLQYLDLKSNFFYGPIPFSLGKLSKLIELHLSLNRLDGTLPSNIQKLVHLQGLHLSSNKFYGFIPQTLGELVSLHVLDLSNNSFDGPVPQSLGKLVNLQVLDLSSNSFDNSIPQSLVELINLQVLDFSNNYFDGLIPQSIGELVNLQVLDLSNNSFNGPIPQNLRQLVNLIRLNLSSNELDGKVSTGNEWLSAMSQLQYLDLSNNQISGSLPKNIGHIMPYLGTLLLGNNHINGLIPISLCQTKLQKLDLSKNNLSGDIPNCWKDNQGWEEINLSSNKLSGVFPSSFGNLSSLLWLHLNNNNLQGGLLVSLRNLKPLIILDLGENKFSGGIPSWNINTFPSLQILRLRQNMLNGSIPLELCQLASLKILDLSRNKLEGSIPWCIGNLSGMTLKESSDTTKVEWDPMLHNESAISGGWYKEDVKQVIKGTEIDYIKILRLVVNMDLSENNLVGSIPNEITWLTGLHGLNLSNNHLKGEIPKMIGDMKSLESLDVSYNQLSGTIPISMPTLTALSHLNLSHNNFSGPIPKDNQFSTYDSSIYAGNRYLCGPPLPNRCVGDDSHHFNGSMGYKDEDDKKDDVENVWFYFTKAAGFATGFWGVIGTLWLKKNWRHAYFRWAEEVADNIYVAIAINVAKLKK